MKPSLKVNLKTRPKYSSVGEPDKGMKEIIDEYNRWFEQFEKQLRDTNNLEYTHLYLNKLWIKVEDVLGY